MNFYQNLKKICDLKATNITSVLDNLELSRSHGTNWNKGSVPSLEIAAKIANYLNISVDYLATGNENFLTANEQLLLADYKKLSDTNKHLITQHMQALIELQESENKTVSIKHSKHKVSAGLGDALYDADNFENILIYDSDIVSKADFALTVDGDSMMPKLYNDDIILVKQQDAVDVGEICVYILSGEGFVKKYGGDRLISLNPKYKDILLENYSTDEIKCCGLVLGKAQIADLN